MIPTRYDRIALKPWHVVLALCAAYALLTLAAHGGDPMAFVAMGNLCDLPPPADTEAVEGYDGQFAYRIAADPLNAHAIINRCDVAAYRYQRILYPALARVLALGQVNLLPWAMLLINLAAIPVGTYCLERLLMRQRVSRWYALSYGLFGGTLIGLRLDLTEPLAGALALGALWALAAARPWLGAGLLALAALGKETALLMAGGWLLYLLAARRWREAIRYGALAAGPFSLWQIALWAWLGSPGVGSGGAKATPFEWFPYNGVWRIVTDPAVRAALGRDEGGAALPALAVIAGLAAAVAVLPSAWALAQSSLDLRAGWRARETPHLYVFLLFAHAAVMPFVPFSTYREPLGVMRFVVGLVMATVLYGAAARRPRALNNFLILWTVTLLYALGYAFA